MVDKIKIIEKLNHISINDGSKKKILYFCITKIAIKKIKDVDPKGVR